MCSEVAGGWRGGSDGQCQLCRVELLQYVHLHEQRHHVGQAHVCTQLVALTALLTRLARTTGRVFLLLLARAQRVGGAGRDRDAGVAC